jgi:hypothetical protein
MKITIAAAILLTSVIAIAQNGGSSEAHLGQQSQRPVP